MPGPSQAAASVLETSSEGEGRKGAPLEFSTYPPSARGDLRPHLGRVDLTGERRCCARGRGTALPVDPQKRPQKNYTHTSRPSPARLFTTGQLRPCHGQVMLYYSRQWLMPRTHLTANRSHKRSMCADGCLGLATFPK